MDDYSEMSSNGKRKFENVDIDGGEYSDDLDKNHY